MSQNAINTPGGGQGFVDTMNHLEPINRDGNIKISATPLTDEKGNIQTDEFGRTRYITYMSNERKGMPLESTRRRSEKMQNTLLSFNQFIRDVGKQLGYDEDQQTAADRIVASIFANPDNAYQDMNRLIPS